MPEIGARALTATAVLLSLLTPTNAHAAGAADAHSREQAAALLRKGARLTERADYAGALQAFEQAYGLYPSPKIDFNIGVTYEALGRDVPAHGALSRFLADPRDAPASTVAKARALLAAIGTRLARLTVSAEVPAGTEVLIDGQSRGRTPMTSAIVLAPGLHEIGLRREDWTHMERSALVAGQEHVVRAHLPAPAPSPEAAPPSRAAMLPKIPPDPVPRARPTLLSELASPPHDLTAQPVPLYRRTWFWVTIGAAVAAVAVGSVALYGRRTEYPPVDARVPLQ